MDSLKYTEQSKYDDLQNQWNSYSPNTIFSIFDSVDIPDNMDTVDWIVLHPNIDPDIVIIEGEYTVVINDGKKRSFKMINPTWRMIGELFEEVNDGHHIFIEGISLFAKNNTLEIVTGS